MAFRFRLDPVLKVRKHKEKLQKQKLTTELQKKKEIDDIRIEAQEKLCHYLHVSGQSDISQIHDLQRHGRHMEQVHEWIAKLDHDLGAVENGVVRERKKLAEAHKDRHVLEKVKEGELELFRKKLEKFEQKMLDEIATQSYGR